jgi:molybdenum cofactor cytidylyltransferase
MKDLRLVGIYLAAGQSSRMGRDKLDLPFGEMCLGSWAFKEALESKLHSVIAVTRKGQSHQWLKPFFSNSGWVQIDVDGNHQSDSLKAGIKEAESLGANGVLVMLADQPFVTKEMINQLVEGFYANSFISFSKKGKAMPPVLFSSSLFNRIRSLEGDQGARSIIRNDLAGRQIEIKDELPFLDIDTLDDYFKYSRVMHSRIAE